MSYVDDLVAEYGRVVAVPWERNLSPAQRVWMAVYPPESESRLRLHFSEFERVTRDAEHTWEEIDVTTAFERWMGTHDYRDAYFDAPELLSSAMPSFMEHLVSEVAQQLKKKTDPQGVVGLLGVGALFGLGDTVKVSALLDAVQDSIAGRLLVFFPGSYEANRYRLLDARDGWNYLAIPIMPNGGGR